MNFLDVGKNGFQPPIRRRRRVKYVLTPPLQHFRRRPRLLSCASITVDSRSRIQSLSKSNLSGPEQKIAIEDVIEKVSLEQSLPAGELDETASLGETNEPGMELRGSEPWFKEN